MSKDKWQPQESFLLRSILQDDNSHSIKRQISDERSFAFSAPPALFDIGFKIDQTQIDNWDFEEPQTEQKIQIKPTLDKKTEKITLFSPQITPQKHTLSPQTSQFTTFSLYPINEPNYFQHSNILNELMSNLNQVSSWARDQHGSRSVQEILENGSDEIKDEIFNCIFHESKELMQDRFGNYVFQKFFEKGLPKHKCLLLKSLRGSIVELSQHAFGCRVIQKAIESIANNPNEQSTFIKEIEPSSLEMIENQNGNHVIQKCFQIIQKDKMNAIIAVIIANLSTLAFHAYGCRVIQKYLENAEKGLTSKLVLSQLLRMGLELSQCQYGNYVMQYIVSSCPEQQQKVTQIFFDHFVILSCNKYASNVIEKAIKYSSQPFRDRLAQWLTTAAVKDLVLLAKHQFANYVIQSLYEKVPRELKTALKSRLKENAQQITKSQYGRHVLMQLEKYR